MIFIWSHLRPVYRQRREAFSSLCTRHREACGRAAGGFAESLGLLVPHPPNYSHTQDRFPAAAGGIGPLEGPGALQGP